MNKYGKGEENGKCFEWIPIIQPNTYFYNYIYHHYISPNSSTADHRSLPLISTEYLRFRNLPNYDKIFLCKYKLCPIGLNRLVTN